MGLLAVIGCVLVHLETQRELDALVAEELEEMIPPFAASSGTREDFVACVEELQDSHPYNDMAWRVWKRADGSLWGSFGRSELHASLPAAPGETPSLGGFMRWRTMPLNDELELGLLLAGGHEVASEKMFMLVALSTVVLAAGFSFLAGRFLGRRIGGALHGIASDARAGALGSALAPSVDRLPDEMRDVVAALGEALTRIREESDQARLLASGLAHELRTPLQNLLLQAEIALLRERTSDEYRGALSKQIHEMQELIRAVDNLVTLCASPEARRARHGEVFDLAAEARLRLRGEEARAEVDGIRVQADLPRALSFRGDRESLMLALRNLVANAIDWSPAGGRVEVRMESGERAVRIVVDDQGPGVPESERQRIFLPFERGSARRDGRVGYGLGLALVRTVVELHHGTVQVASSPLGGASFRLELPHAPEEARAAP